jgi:hypothetical protein
MESHGEMILTRKTEEPVGGRSLETYSYLTYKNNDKILIIFLLKILVVNSDTLTIEIEENDYKCSKGENV